MGSISYLLHLLQTNSGPPQLPLFRTIQVCPKDSPTARRQAEDAVSFHQQSWRGSMPKTGAPHLKRRDFITLLGSAAAWPLAARAQHQPKMLRVGFAGMQPRESPLYANFLKRMAELGYQEGRNFTFDYIQTPNIEGHEKNYRELATRKVDIFLAVGNEPALLAALSAADGRPIAFLAIDFDPLAKGYVANLSTPGGNVTGIFVRETELAAKRAEIAREA